MAVWGSAIVPLPWSPPPRRPGRFVGPWQMASKVRQVASKVGQVVARAAQAPTARTDSWRRTVDVDDGGGPPAKTQDTWPQFRWRKIDKVDKVLAVVPRPTGRSDF